MLNYRVSALALGLCTATHAMASEQSQAQGFIEDSRLNLLLRNAYMNRDYKHGIEDRAEWGQGVIANFSSGFTQGTVGVGVDAFGLYALRLDGGSGRSGSGGIDFFKQDSHGNAKHDLARMGAAIKFRVSNTELRYGEMMPALPVLNHEDTRLLPESFTGYLVTSRELEGLELNAGHFTAQTRESAEGTDSGGLKRVDVFGGSYRFNENFNASLYTSDVQDRVKKQYLGMTYVMPLAMDRSLALDFNGYRSHLDQAYANRLETGQNNKIWSLAATYATGPHSLTLAHQRSSGSTGYNYGGYAKHDGIGDGGSSILLANSYWSDFNAEDERSWQLAYGLNFASLGVPGLSYNVAYVRGDNIRTNDGSGTEREWFNQLQYVVQAGAAKDLTVRLRNSFLRTSTNVRDAGYNDDGSEVRLFVEYPLSLL
ncbi:OprD family porin [Pseudomonas sp. RIT-PI-S]|uniref:OprD family porin n=1 Tax=Pseudomonas sp. RIT-PI-S TaxID=3035295 RepID=UPI0021DA8FDA|nr:OprD family porin [Pseudomonas sp. RIT-PI-S]